MLAGIEVSCVMYAVTNPPVRCTTNWLIVGQNELVTGPANDGTVRLVAHKPGLVTLTVSVSVTDPQTDPNKQQLVDNTALSATLQVKVRQGRALIPGHC